MKKHNFIVYYNESHAKSVQAEDADTAWRMVCVEGKGKSVFYDRETVAVEQEFDAANAKWTEQPVKKDEVLCPSDCLCGWCEVGKWLKEGINGEV